MTDREQFMSEVRRVAEGTPYTVKPTESGFDVRTDVANAQWYALMYKQGVHKVFTHHVTLDEATGRYTVTDDGYEVEWQAGAEAKGETPKPVLRARAERQTGTVREFSFRKVYAWNEQGEYGKVLDYTFSSGEGNQLIHEAAGRLGLKKRMSASSRAGLVMGAIGGVGAVAAMVTLLVFALLGKF
jgi:hypothetical protein